MASGTGMSNIGNVAPISESNTSISGVGGLQGTNSLNGSYKIDQPSSLGGNSGLFESKMSGAIWKGGYIPYSIEKPMKKKTKKEKKTKGGYIPYSVEKPMKNKTKKEKKTKKTKTDV